jgi:hypothetical protein
MPRVGDLLEGKIQVSGDIIICGVCPVYIVVLAATLSL